MSRDRFKDWNLPVGRLFLAAGPCSAESEEQVLATARALAGHDLAFLRAGLWKPRTRPGCFEGVGLKGLSWLDRARSETGLNIGTEVAEPAHVEACLEYGVDVLWIGARTTTNPFSVQALADVLKGTDVPVLVKNPMTPDIGLWMGAIERIANAGVKKIGAIHRGVTSTLETRYRNAPHWRMPIELKRLLPDIPLICDPSHICGKAELIPVIAQEAMDLLFDGLMLEVHPDPSNALSDAAQQVTPERLFAIVESLTLSHEESDNPGFKVRLDSLRGQVDDLDTRMLELLGQRMDIVSEMGRLKAEESVSTFQPHRWDEIVADRVKKGKGFNLTEEFVLQVLQSIHEEAIRRQETDRLEGAD